MKTKADDKKTGSSGKEAVEGAEGTQTDEKEKSNSEGQQGDEDEGEQTPSESDTGDDKSGKPEDEKKFTQADVDRILQERLDREKKKKAGEFEKLFNESEGKLAKANERLSEMEAEVKEEREAARSALQAEVDALPAEVKAMAPDISSKGGLKKVREWLPNAKKLAAKLSGKGEGETKETHKPGNEGDPPPSGKTKKESPDEITKVASRHSIYRSF